MKCKDWCCEVNEKGAMWKLVARKQQQQQHIKRQRPLLCHKNVQHTKTFYLHKLHPLAFYSQFPKEFFYPSICMCVPYFHFLFVFISFHCFRLLLTFFYCSFIHAYKNRCLSYNMWCINSKEHVVLWMERKRKKKKNYWKVF